MGMNIEPTRFALIMQATLENELRAKLKEPLMKIAEEHVDKSIDEAISELNIRATVYKDHQYWRDVVEFIVRRDTL